MSTIALEKRNRGEGILQILPPVLVRRVSHSLTVPVLFCTSMSSGADRCRVKMYQSLSRMRNAVEGGSGEQPSWGSPSYRFGFSVLSRAQLPPFSSPRLTHRLAHPRLPNILTITPDSPLSALLLLHTVRAGGC